MALYGFDILGLLSQAGSAVLDIGTAEIQTEAQKTAAAQAAKTAAEQANVQYSQWALPAAIVIISGTFLFILFRKKK